MRHPVVAVSVPVRASARAIPEIVLEAGYQQGIDLARASLLPLSPLDSVERARARAELADGLLLTGGADVDPRRYGEDPDGAREVSLERDEIEFAVLADALHRGDPVLAICRGMQVLNVSLGGSLYQDLATQRPAAVHVDHDRRHTIDRPIHDIRVEEPELLEGVFADAVFSPNSSHHQGVRDLGEGLAPVCRAEDGLVEALEYRGRPGSWIVGVQWHPERMIGEGSGAHRRLFRKFGKEVRLRARKGVS